MGPDSCLATAAAPQTGVCAAGLGVPPRAAPLSLVWPLGPDLASPGPRSPEGAEPALSPCSGLGLPSKKTEASKPRLPAACLLVSSKREPQAPHHAKTGRGPALSGSGQRPEARGELTVRAWRASCSCGDWILWASSQGAWVGLRGTRTPALRAETRNSPAPSPPRRVDRPPARPQDAGGP